MASCPGGLSALECCPDEEENRATSLQAPFDSTSNEILLFHNNNLVLKAERGVTLGLIKLIYSSDDDNSGVILGVKPRLTNQVPCLVTFDSTSLNYDAYDLIIKDFRSGPSNNDIGCNAEQSSINLLQHFSIGENSAQGNPSQDMHIGRQASPEQPSSIPSKDYELTTSNANEFNSTDGPLGSPTEVDNVFLENSGSQDDCCKGGELQGISQRDLNLSESEHSPGTDSRKNDTVEGNDNDEGNGNGNEAGNENEEENENEEKFQFNPEDFDFDIKSVTPTKTDKGLRWPCDQCGKDYCSASHLKRHWILHTDFKPYKCSLCSKRFPFHWDLKRHMTKHTGNKRYKCPHCTKSFNTQKELKCHNWLHTGQKMYKCDICHHEISSSGNLKIHMRKHTGEKPYKCEYCPKAFYMLGHYQYHVRRHTGEKPYKCDVCGMAFSYSVNLNEHKNIHTGVKPYSCSTCDKKFTHRSTLKQHILTHSGQRPYKCHLCSKNFIQSSNYRNHLITHKDKEDRAQKCDLCGKELLSRRGVKKHRQRCAQNLLDRANGVATKKSKRKNSNKGRYECGVCSKLFTYRANYDAHCKKPHPIRKKQKERTKAPKQNKSAVNSANPNKVSCPICGKQFLYMKCIKRHLQKRHAGIEVGTRPSNTVTCRPTNTQGQMDMTETTGQSGNNETSTHTSPHDKTKTPQAGLPVLVETVPTVHIQPVGELSSSNVTLIYVPSASVQSSSTTKCTSLLTVLPKMRPDRVSKTTKVAKTKSVKPAFNSTAGSADVSFYPLPKQTSNNDKTSKGAETGSQAITALKRLSANIGIEDQFEALASRKDEQRPPISKHLTALEQLSKRVGVVDEIPVNIEAVHEPSEAVTVGSIAKDAANLQIGDNKEEKGPIETNAVQEK